MYLSWITNSTLFSFLLIRLRFCFHLEALQDAPVDFFSWPPIASVCPYNLDYCLITCSICDSASVCLMHRTFTSHWVRTRACLCSAAAPWGALLSHLRSLSPLRQDMILAHGSEVHGFSSFRAKRLQSKSELYVQGRVPSDEPWSASSHLQNSGVS